MKNIYGCKFNCYFIMPRCMCAQNLRVISAFLHIFKNNNQTIHPHEDNNWYLHRCPITDIYTAAHPCKYQLLPELLFFENYLFLNISIEFCFFVFLLSNKFKSNEKGDLSPEIFFHFANLPWKWANNAFFSSYHDEWHRYIIKPLLHGIGFYSLVFVLFLFWLG